MRLLPLVALLCLPALATASAQQTTAVDTLDQRLTQARAEAEAAERQSDALEKAALQAHDEAARLGGRQLAAAEAIAAAEARITAADAALRIVGARQAALKSRLEREQRPVSALLGGLGLMAARPPLLSLAGADSTEELVRVRILVASTLPVIRQRTEGLRNQLAATARLRDEAALARDQLSRSRAELASKRLQFAQLEKQAIAIAAQSDARALVAGDAAIAASEDLAELGDTAQQARTASAIASLLSREPAPPPGPTAGQTARTPFAYALPAEAPVLVGLGAVSASGVRSRGVTLGTRRGVLVAAPAAGTVRFAGPFSDYDGVVIIDHGAGWLSLVVNVATPLKKGDEVSLGDPLGRALGPIDVELTHGGRRLSPALIARSSAPLSKSRQGS